MSADGSPTTRLRAARAAAERALALEASAVSSLRGRLDERFDRALALLYAAGGVVVTGLGKSGIIGHKIAATLSSTGTPSAFVHAADSLHGDAGALRAGDGLVALSHSGATPEVCAFAAMAARLGPVVAITGVADSPLAGLAGAVLDTSVPSEADPLRLAPTSSSTAALAMGDALAVGLMVLRGTSAEDFARNHPAGALGARVRAELDVGDV